MKKKTTKSKVDVSEIKLLTYDEIERGFKVSKEDIQKFLKAKNSDTNYYYPGLTFDEKITREIVKLFVMAFPGIDVLDKSKNHQYIEIFLNTMERHVFRYSVEKHFKRNC